MEYGLIVTDVRMIIKDGNGMKAICNIVVNDMIAINGIRVIENSETGKLMVAMPSKKMVDGSYRDSAHPVSLKGREIIEKAVLDEYNKIKENKPMTFNERLLQAEAKGYTTVLVEGENRAFFIEEKNPVVGSIVKGSLGHEFKVIRILSESRVSAKEVL